MELELERWEGYNVLLGRAARDAEASEAAARFEEEALAHKDDGLGLTPEERELIEVSLAEEARVAEAERAAEAAALAESAAEEARVAAAERAAEAAALALSEAEAAGVEAAQRAAEERAAEASARALRAVRQARDASRAQRAREASGHHRVERGGGGGGRASSAAMFPLYPTTPQPKHSHHWQSRPPPETAPRPALYCIVLLGPSVRRNSTKQGRGPYHAVEGAVLFVLRQRTRWVTRGHEVQACTGSLNQQLNRASYVHHLGAACVMRRTPLCRYTVPGARIAEPTVVWMSNKATRSRLRSSHSPAPKAPQRWSHANPRARRSP